MKKTGFLVGLILCVSSIVAQIQITSSAMPSAGDTLRYSSVNPSGLSLNLGQTGASQSWDYSSWKSNGQDIYDYIAANKSPYLFYFFNQIGLKTADSFGVGQFQFKNIYSFYTKNSSVFKAEGLGYSFSGIPLAANYTDEDEIYQFPLAYNDSDVSTFRFKFSIPGQTLFSVIQKGTRTNIVDGWGSIKTPYKTYTDVIRVKTIVDEIDSIQSSFGSVPFPRKQVIYKWLSPDEKIPVLEITGTLNGTTFTATQIRFRDAFNGLGNPLKPSARFDVDKTSGYANVDTFKLSDRSTPFASSWQWQISPAGSAVFVNGTTAASRNPTLIFTNKGLYSVSLLATNLGGTDDTTAVDLIQIDFGAQTKNVSLSPSEIYPNPCSGILNIDSKYVGEIFRIVDATGKLYVEDKVSDQSIQIGSLSAGLYYISVGNKSMPLVLTH